MVELIVAVSVLAILTVAALPSFSAFRQRSALRGAADQAVAFWNDSRFQSVKRNAMVKVGLKKSVDGTFCLGAATTTNASDTTPCDCTAAAPATDICDVARFPASQGEWNGASLSTSSAVAVLEPKRGSLADPSVAGVLGSLAAPEGPMDYTLNIHVDALGRAVVCQSASDGTTLSGYEGRRCSP